MIWVIRATHVKDYQIHICFNDGSDGVIDLRDTIFADPRPIFSDLKDMTKFKNFSVDLDTIVWANGLDLAPEFLHSLLGQTSCQALIP